MNQSVTKVELKHAINTGISWGCIGEGMVPFFEEQSARLEYRKSIDEWSNMDEMEKALVIAVRRINIASKNIGVEAEIESSKASKGKR